MSFPKSKVKRFNEDVSCAPPVGHYDPVLAGRVKVPSVDARDARSKKPRVSHQSRSSSMFSRMGIANSESRESLLLARSRMEVSRCHSNSVFSTRERQQDLNDQLQKVIRERDALLLRLEGKEELERKMSEMLIEVKKLRTGETERMEQLVPVDEMAKELDSLKVKLIEQQKVETGLRAETSSLMNLVSDLEGSLAEEKQSRERERQALKGTMEKLSGLITEERAMRMRTQEESLSLLDKLSEAELKVNSRDEQILTLEYLVAECQAELDKEKARKSELRSHLKDLDVALEDLERQEGRVGDLMSVVNEEKDERNQVQRHLLTLVDLWRTRVLELIDDVDDSWCKEVLCQLLSDFESSNDLVESFEAVTWTQLRTLEILIQSLTEIVKSKRMIERKDREFQNMRDYVDNLEENDDYKEDIISKMLIVLGDMRSGRFRRWLKRKCIRVSQLGFKLEAANRQLDDSNRRVEELVRLLEERDACILALGIRQQNQASLLREMEYQLKVKGHLLVEAKYQLEGMAFQLQEKEYQLHMEKGISIQAQADCMTPKVGVTNLVLQQDAHMGGLIWCMNNGCHTIWAERAYYLWTIQRMGQLQAETASALNWVTQEKQRLESMYSDGMVVAAQQHNRFQESVGGITCHAKNLAITKKKLRGSRKHVDYLRKKLGAKEEECDDLKSKLEAKEKEADDLKSKLEDKEKETDDLKSKLEDKEKEADDLKSKLEDKEKETDGLKSKLEDKEKEADDLKSKLEDKEKETDDLISFKSKVEELQRQIDTLEEQLRVSDKERASILEGLNQERQKFLLECQEVRFAHYREMRDIMAQVRSQMEGEITDLKEKVVGQKLESEGWKALYDERRREAESHKYIVEKCELEKRVLLGKVEALREELDIMSSQIQKIGYQNHEQMIRFIIRLKLEDVDRKETIATLQTIAIVARHRIEKLTSEPECLEGKKSSNLAVAFGVSKMSEPEVEGACAPFGRREPFTVQRPGSSKGTSSMAASEGAGGRHSALPTVVEEDQDDAS